MDLHSGLPYWPMLHGIMGSYPSLAKNADCEVAIIGGGITGAIIAWHLSEQGHEVLLVDRRHVGMGSTAASTALLQYELDTPLNKLIRMRGEEQAVRGYRLCEKAVHDLQTLCHELGQDTLCSNSGSFQFASFRKDLRALQEEFNCRKKAGIKVEWLDEYAVKDKYCIDKSGGILSQTGASLDAYALTHYLLQDAIQRNLGVYDHTEIEQIEYNKRTTFLHTKEGIKIKTRKVIIACGYESEQFLPMKVQKLHSTFAIISEPLPKREYWYRNTMIWETASPYLYIRTTNDNRIAIGGKDSDGSDPSKRYRLLPLKKKQLESAFAKLFPEIPITTDFAWAGSFASTRDGLPYIGTVAQCPNTFFVLGLGGNGIPFSMVATDLVKNWLNKKPDKNMQLFSFDR